MHIVFAQEECFLGPFNPVDPVAKANDRQPVERRQANVPATIAQDNILVTDARSAACRLGRQPPVRNSSLAGPNHHDDACSRLDDNFAGAANDRKALPDCRKSF